MHNPKSKRLPIREPDHTYKITELTDLDHHKHLAEVHYKKVKRVQCITDYNTAVDNLSDLYDNVMNAQEYEESCSIH